MFEYFLVVGWGFARLQDDDSLTDCQRAQEKPEERRGAPRGDKKSGGGPWPYKALKGPYKALSRPQNEQSQNLASWYQAVTIAS